jgi:bacterioferritin
MKGDLQVIEYFDKALRHELTAVNQYWLHYRLLDNWGDKTLAKIWRSESIEEMQHADKIIERIIFLEGAPNMQTLEAGQSRCLLKLVKQAPLVESYAARSFLPRSWLSSSVC